MSGVGNSNTNNFHEVLTLTFSQVSVIIKVGQIRFTGLSEEKNRLT